MITNVTSPTSTTLNITWTPIDEEYLHGIPRGYCVYYRASGSSVTNLKEIPDITQLNTTITSLQPYTRYFLQVAAKTTPGCGAKAKTDIFTQPEGKES